MKMENTLEAFVDDEAAQRFPCPICHRKFNEDVLPRHKNICEKSMKKRRKPFNSEKQRSMGSCDIPVERKQTQKPAIIPKKNNWRAKHEAFLTSIRAARGPSSTSQGSGAYVPPAAAVVNPDYVQCPHCERRFNEHSAQRHIEFCKEQKSRIPSKKAGAENLTKLSKRTQYKPPLPGNKRLAPNSGSANRNRRQQQVLSPKYNDGSDQSSFGKGDKVSRARMDSEFASSFLDNDVTNKKVVRRTQSTKSSVSPKEDISRRHSTNASAGNKDRNTNGSHTHISKNRMSNGLSSVSKVNDTDTCLFHDDDISRAASGSRKNRNRQRPSAAFQDDFNGLGQKLGPRFSNVENMVDGSVSGEDSDGCRSIGSGRRKGYRCSSPSSDLLKKESSVSVGSNNIRSGTRLSKFCYECGTKYPVVHAKYCCECGVKRLCIDT